MLPRIPLIDSTQRLLSRPSWNDATLMTYANEWTFTTVNTNGSLQQLFVPPNPKRWAIGFTSGRIPLAAAFISPTDNPNVYGVALSADPRDNWYTIFEFGPVIQQEWYVSCAGVTPIGIFEIEIGELARNDSSRLCTCKTDTNDLSRYNSGRHSSNESY